MKKDQVSLFLDCGAPSWYNKYIRAGGKDSGVHAGTHFKDRYKDDFSFLEKGHELNETYLKYRDDYIAFVKKYKKYIDVYSNLDVINNAEYTWENQQYIESKGLNPIPVFHVGSDFKWLEMYLRKGYKYVALGGLVPNSPAVLLPLLDNIWSKYLTDKKGIPIVKVHGFAMTSLRMIIRYPWYSVDSTSWVLTGRFGSVYVPIRKGNKYIYDKNSLKICVSTQSPSKKEAGKHFYTLTKREQEEVTRYFDLHNFKIGESEFFNKSKDYKLEKDERFISKPDKNNNRKVERVIEPGLSNDYKQRDELNIIYFLDLEKSLPEWPWAFKLEGVTRRRFGK